MLAATPVSGTSSKTYGKVTQYVLLGWNKDGNYIELSKLSSWWTRSSTSYSVKDGYQYASSQGNNKSGSPVSCAESYTIGTPDFYSNETATYTSFLTDDCQYTYYNSVTGGIGAYTRGDIYSGSTKVYDNFRTSITP